MNKTLDQITEELKAHFSQDQLEFKVGATNTDKTEGLALAYVQARAIQYRLDEVVGFANWRVEYRQRCNYQKRMSSLTAKRPLVLRTSLS